MDSTGALVTKLPPENAHVGLNRGSWNMRYDPPRLIALRTTPKMNPHIWEEPRFQGQDTRPVTHWGTAEAEVGPIAAPGTYTLRLTVNGQTYTQPLEVILPPNSPATPTEIQSSVRTQLRVRDAISNVADMANQIEWMRKMLEDDLKAQASNADLVTKMNGIDKKLETVENILISPWNRLSDDKYYVHSYALYLNLIWFNGEIGTGAGDVAGAGDYGMTETALGLWQGYAQELTAAQSAYKTLMDRDVPAYNQSIAGSVQPLPTTGAPPAPARRGRGFGGPDNPGDPD